MADRVLVTGASGFVGHRVLEALATHGVVLGGVARTPAGDGSSEITWFGCDLLDPRAAAEVIRAFRPDVLVHCAWYARHGLFWTAPDNEAWFNATAALAEAFRDAGGKRFVGIGSCAEYDWTRATAVPMPESHPLAPATPYGRAKCAAATRVAALCDRAGMSFAWVRLFHLFGAGEHPERLVAAVAGALLRGEVVAVGSGRHVRDFCDVGYAGRAIAAVACIDTPSAVNASMVNVGAVNVGSEQPMPIADIVRLIGSLVGRPELIRLGARPDRPDDPPSLVPDLQRLHAEIGFTEPHDFGGALYRYIEHLRRTADR